MRIAEFCWRIWTNSKSRSYHHIYFLELAYHPEGAEQQMMMNTLAARAIRHGVCAETGHVIIIREHKTFADNKAGKGTNEAAEHKQFTMTAMVLDSDTCRGMRPVIIMPQLP
ncbi:hypothetical protein AVEN_120721-1 [Araneus ventricosus]|uniref:Uncharacterized protein n=1 Tax=Araneus ventricosus TaxID=182803 RepID=A0A4Y2JM06_ARAVE|nr:hypothetical protein AVEN_120721-1 [Araneus ventricosus]